MLAGVIALYIIFTGVGHICPEFAGVRDSRLSQNGFSPGRKKTGENSPGTTGEGFFWVNFPPGSTGEGFHRVSETGVSILSQNMQYQFNRNVFD